MGTDQCRICLKREIPVWKISDVDEDNVKLSHKLQYVAPEVDWLDKYLICKSCTGELNIAYKFKTKCVSFNLESKNLKTELRNDSDNFSSNYVDNDSCDSDTTKDEINPEDDDKILINQDCYVCYNCSEKCTTKDELIIHIKNFHENDSKLSEHEERCDDGEKDFRCLKCGRKYVLEASLQQHLHDCDGIKRHDKGNCNYQCDMCSKYYSTKKILSRHKKNCVEQTDIKSKRFQCIKCYKLYISLKSLQQHLRRGCKKDVGNDVNTFFCKVCEEYFKSTLVLKQHILAAHKTSDYICHECVVNFNTKEEYDSHNDAKHSSEKTGMTKRRGQRSSRKFTCEVCGEQFTLLKSTIEHCLNVHSMDEKSIRPYSCEKCDNRFKSSTNLLNHILYHDRNRTNICSFCGKSFITKNDLTAHENIHVNRRNYKCVKCEKAFKTNTNLRTHLLIVHTNPSLWKYICHICNKRFPQKSNYDQHLRRHIGEKNFICPLCKKAFASKSEMQEHFSYHSNVKAYKCSICGKEYRKKYTYDVHLAKVHGLGNAKIPVRERKHACHICPSRFYDRIKLARHLCTHSGLKPYPCYVCEKKFTDKSYLKHHLKMAHNIIEESKRDWNK